MSRMATIAGRFVERSTGLIPMPWAATIGIAFLVNWIFDIVPATGKLADAVGWRLGGARRGVDGAALNQTSLVHSLPPLTNTDRYRYSSHTRLDRPSWVWIDGYRQRMPAHPRSGPPAPQPRQRRQLSAVAISAALHRGSKR
jgi:hypothetical protein